MWFQWCILDLWLRIFFPLCHVGVLISLIFLLKLRLNGFNKVVNMTLPLFVFTFFHMIVEISAELNNNVDNLGLENVRNMENWDVSFLRFELKISVPSPPSTHLADINIRLVWMTLRIFTFICTWVLSKCVRCFGFN